MALSVDVHPGLARPVPAAEAPATKTAIWWFLASEIMVFGGLIASFVVFRLGAGGWHEAASHLAVPLAAFNTFVLLTSSLTMVQAHAAAERGDAGAFRRQLGATILLGLVFLAVKGVEYGGKLQAGYTPATGTFWSFYFALTGLHALHVLGGLVANVAVLATSGVGRAHRVEAVGLYWHFVDIVWIFLFPLVYLS